MSLMIFTMIHQLSLGQLQNKNFKLVATEPQTITLNQSFTSSSEITPFENNVNKIFGLAVSAEITLKNETSIVRFILVDKNYNEYLIYESNYLLDETLVPFNIDEICEETSLLNSINVKSIKIEINDAGVNLKSLTYTRSVQNGINFEQVKREKKRDQNVEKVDRINKKLKEKGIHWIAGPTEVSELTYSEKKKLYGQSTFPPGFEYYSGGVISTAPVTSLKSASTESLFVAYWDWRNRHGKNFISPVTNQGACGSCWAFASTGATEAMVNVFFNQQLNLDLSEQDVLSCSGAGDCGGGYPSTALTYITNTGVVDEAAFPYSQADESCSSKASNPSELIQISGRVDFGSTTYPRSEDDLKRMLIEMGPLSGGLYDWSHAMVLVGYQVVKEGDVFYYRDLNLSRSWKTIAAGDPLIGKTVWIFKNSWGPYFGDAGYVYVETPISNVGWTHGLKTPVKSAVKNYQVVCEDKDGDGYFWWGLGEKPVTCTGPDQPDGDDSDPTLGPLDQYGNCISLNSLVPPVANFSADKTSISAGEFVSFNDLSTNNPTSWSWIFEGGTPAASNLKNPVVSYNSPGSFRVSLTTSNANGTDSKINESYIEVLPNKQDYCTTTGNSANEWISLVQIGENSNSSGPGGFQDFTNLVFNFASGSVYDLVLVPEFSSKGNFEYWSVWIDFNADMDFDDPGELVFTATKQRSAVSGSITIPGGNPIDTRMRIAMGESAPGNCGEIGYGEVEDYSIHITDFVPLPPAADFTAANTNIITGENIQFSDQSINEPTNWNWSFFGGEPSTSTERNPVVRYSSPGEYDVELVVSKPGFSESRKIKQKFIVVAENNKNDFCSPVSVNSSKDYIQNLNIETVFSNTTLGNQYSFSGETIALVPGKSYSVVLTPHLTTTRNYWKIWIDFNDDKDFDDAGETLLAISNKKGSVNSVINIPSGVTGTKRMRISMKEGKEPLPCDDSFNGEVEDYTVSFETAASNSEIFTAINKFDAIKNQICTIYPIPAHNMLKLELDASSQGDYYTIYNINGDKMAKNKIVSSLSEIDISGFPTGIYLMSIVKSNKIYNKKFIKK